MDAFQITVVAGRHSGAVTKFGSGSVLAVGPGLSNDIVLTDLAQHGSGHSAEVFRLAHMGLGAVRVFAIGASIQVNGKTIAEGAETAAFLPCTVCVGAVKLLMEGDCAREDTPDLDPKPALAEAVANIAHPSRLKRYLRNGTVGALGCFGLMVAGIGLSNSADTGSDTQRLFAAEAAISTAAAIDIDDVLAPLDLSLFETARDITPEYQVSTTEEFEVGNLMQQPDLGLNERVDLPNPTQTLDRAVAFLEVAAETANISSVRFEASGNIVVAHGELTEAERSAWRSIPPAFDTEFNASYILLTEFDRRIPQTELPERPRSVWLSDAPYIVDGTGMRRKAGDTTSEGWTVTSISREGIGFEKDGRVVVVSLFGEGIN